MNNQIAQTEATCRWVTIITGGALGLAVMLSGSYIEPYSHGIGPVILLVLLGAYLAAFLWMRHLVRDAHDALQAGDLATASAGAEQMSLPVSALALAVVALLGCPALLRIMG